MEKRTPSMKHPEIDHKKEELISRLQGRPLLLILFLDWRFRIAFLLFLLIVTFVAASIPKIWKVSPKDFTPEVRISVVDMIQAWSLARAARKHEAEGRNEQAARAWLEAVANHPAKKAYLRGQIEHELTREDFDPRIKGEIVSNARWLLRLTRTNSFDLDLTARLYHRYHLDRYALNLLNGFEGKFSPTQRKIYLMSLFNLGQIDRFLELWNASDPALQRDPELKLYYAAYQAGWTEPRIAAEGHEALEEAENDLELAAVAHRLQLLISTHLLRPDQYEESLQFLEQRGKDTFADHTQYWRLLMAVGKKEQARDLIMGYSHPPVVYTDIVEMLDLLDQFGLEQDAADYLEKYHDAFSYVPGLWFLYAKVLSKTKNWDRMREVAMRIRQSTKFDDSMVGFSFFLDGVAEMGEGRRKTARIAFQRVTEYKLAPPSLGVMTASQMAKLGFYEEAGVMLAGLEPEMRNNESYWFLYFSVAHQLDDLDLMSQCAKRCYELNPNKLVNVSNYAAVLLLKRERIDEIVPLTLRVITKQPRSIIAKVNHSLALVLNKRFEEAAEILSTVDRDRLNPEEAVAYDLVWLELYVERGEFKKAVEVNDRLKGVHLTHSQQSLLRQLRDRIEAAGQTA